MVLPSGWLQTKDSGKIKGTRFIAFKVPLREECLRSIPREKWFTPNCVMRNYPEIKLIIDLTYTTKYGSGEVYEKNGIRYVKMLSPGKVIPSSEIFEKFVEIVEDFLESSPEDYFIGVHCTHGLNRTGYFIVRYMIERLNYDPQVALKEFTESRGHSIYRQHFAEDLLKRKSSTN